jgi:hypothetical protein
LDEISPAPVRRVKSRRFGGAVPLREWIAKNQTTRIGHVAWNFFKQPYECERDRERFVAFLVSLTEGQSAHSRQLAELRRSSVRFGLHRAMLIMRR